MSKGTILAFLFFLPFFGVGCFTFSKAADHVIESRQASQWRIATGKILQVNSTYEVSRTSDGDSRTYYIEGRYYYRVDGRRYEGSRIGLKDRGGMGMVYDSWEESLREKIRSGKEIVVYVDPEDPSQAVIFPELVWDYFAFLMIFAVVFGGVGSCGMLGVFHFARKVGRKKELQALYPSEPWKWVDDWLDGVITANAKWGALGTWALAIFWNCVSAPVAIIIPRELRSDNKLVALALIFPLVGIGLLWAAVRASIRWLKYGRAELVLHTTPGVIGGKLQGAVRAAFPLPFEGAVVIRLECFETVTRRSGGKSESKQELLWQESVELQPAEVSGYSGIPVQFTIPYDCRETSDEGPVGWKLTVEGPTPGVDFHVQFTVPVFKTSQSSPELVNVIQRTDLKGDRGGSIQPPSSSRIIAEETGAGALIAIPPVVARMPGMVTGLVFGAVLFLGATYLTIHLGAPLIFSAVFLLVDLLLLLAVFEWCARKRRIKISSAGVEIITSRLAFRSSQMINAAEIQDVLFSTGGTYQIGGRHQQLYKVQLSAGPPSEIRKIAIAGSVGDKNEARWLVALILKGLGRESQS